MNCAFVQYHNLDGMVFSCDTGRRYGEMTWTDAQMSITNTLPEIPGVSRKVSINLFICLSISDKVL